MRNPTLSLLLLPALLFGACGQQSVSTQPMVSAPVNSHLLPAGVYQVAFQNVGTSDFTATAQLVTPPTLHPQGLVAVPEPAGGGFTFARTSASTFVVQATGTRHVQATFKVTNTTGLTLDSLKFVPVVPTGMSSVFSSVTYFDGSDASSKAGSLSSVQGQNLIAATDQAVTDAGTSPFVTGLDVSGVDTTGRGVSSVTTSGWQVASKLAPGGVAVVTFAVDLPAAPNPKDDPFNFSLNMIGVQDGTTLTSAVQQYNRATKSYGNYVQFPTVGTNSLPAYYDVKNVDRDGVSIASVLCSFDGAFIRNISSPSFPNRYRVRMNSLGAHTLRVYTGSACPLSTNAGPPLLSQPVNGTVPARVPLAAGSYYNLALLSNGTVRSWGDNSAGQLGNNANADTSTHVTVSGLTNAVSLTGGAGHSLALLSDGTVRSWGFNQYGQLGDGTTTNSNTPATVPGLTNAVSVAGGQDHSLALLANGTARSWGRNDFGQLGNGTTTNSNTPATVPGLTNAVSVAGGQDHSLALLADGTVRSWGNNQYGQLGNGTTTNSSTLVTVTGLTDAVSITSGENHSLALLADGTVRSWGNNQYGQLGNGTTTNSSTPVPVTGLTDAVNIAGGRHSVAVLSDGTARSWGDNTNGQLGNGTTTNSRTPVTVSGLTDTVSLTAGLLHSVAVLSDGTARSWGYNGVGQLGNGTTTDSKTPVTVLDLTNALSLWRQRSQLGVAVERQ